VTYSDQYIQTLQHIYDLTKDHQTEIIETDLKITKMFGAWSSIFWALPHFDKFEGLTVEELKQLVKSLIVGHLKYAKTTNQYLQTETIDWIAGIFKRKVSIRFEEDKNEGLYAEKWVKQLYENPTLEYSYSQNIGLKLKEQLDNQELQRKQVDKEKAERLEIAEQKAKKRQFKKQNHFLDHLESNQKQKENREIFLTEFSKLTLVEKLKVIANNTKPLHYYPTDIADVSSELLIELSLDTRNTLYLMIKKYRIKDWYKTRDRIQIIDKKLQI